MTRSTKTMRLKESILSQSEIDGAVWATLKAHLEERIKALRIKNDDKKHDLVDTTFIRGGIDEIKKLIVDVEPKEIIVPSRRQG